MIHRFPSNGLIHELIDSCGMSRDSLEVQWKLCRCKVLSSQSLLRHPQLIKCWHYLETSRTHQTGVTESRALLVES